ncbi:hypothetical protein K2173_007016 [Erythroxylum novogranatense]|uniref:anthocyanidin 3-O-glucosyltransferase n=1 Tax=Erythroxylum novogranatense TaxID=1862640 RepID=A0AAV8SK97_9ROSI|nr:hypothetical protein K2173_007016 [Erythroxylum novogranatense]
MLVKRVLLLVPLNCFGHVVATTEIAKLLVDRDDRIYVTVLTMRLPFDSHNQHTTLTSSTFSERIEILHLSPENPGSSGSPGQDVFSYVASYKTLVKEVVSNQTQSDSSPSSQRLVGFFLDMFCSTMIDVASELGVPSYIYYTSNATFLGFILHIQTLYDEKKLNFTQLEDSNAELIIPSLVKPLPTKVLPSLVFNNDLVRTFLGNTRRFRETKGILVNTFIEYESHAINSLSGGKIPPMYHVGPILNRGSDQSDKCRDFMEWLDQQPKSSVVFLCFGSMGCFDADQVKEIAYALEQTKNRFLWSLRKPPPKGQIRLPTDYADVRDILTEEFLNRTAEIGKVIGWAPQGTILAHPAIGGFVSLCGWNSVLESLWNGVPIAAWPMYAEQQFLAFQMVVELGIAVEIKMDYRKELTSESVILVSSEEIVGGISSVMEQDSEVRKRVVKMSEKSKKSLIKGGSSYCSLGRLIRDVINPQ